MGTPAPGDWLMNHAEHGQSLSEFIGARPERPRAGADTIVIAPIGRLTPAQENVFASVEEYLRPFFGVPVRTRRLDDLVERAVRRSRPDLGWSQVSSRDLLETLAGYRTAGDFAVLGLTAEDLYPDSSWNFVFGQSSPAHRVGVWSIFRFGRADDPRAAEQLLLLRTMKTAAHELGHVLGLPHCITYECVMNGSNSLPELDRRPLELCPSCLAKIAWSTGVDPDRRAQALGDFVAARGLEAMSPVKSWAAARRP